MRRATAADHDELRVVLVLNEGVGSLAGVAGIGAGEALVRRHHEDEALARRVGLQQRMTEIRTRVGSDIPDDLDNFLRIGTVGIGCLFGPAQTRSRDHVHRAGDLPRTLDALDAMAYIL